MDDETIAPKLYRTGRGDRSIPLVLGLLLLASVPALLWVAGPFLWSWGIASAFVAAAGAAGALLRWNRARWSVRWHGSERRIEWRRGRRRLSVSVDELTRIESVPSSVRTKLWSAERVFRLSHRLVRADQLLEHLRHLRPDLFPEPGATLNFRRSSASALLQAGLAGGTFAAGALLAGWQPWLGALFAAAGVYVLVRIAFFIPLRHVVAAESLTTHYALRVKRWGRPVAVREDGYAAGGAVFFRMIVDYGRWRVMLDEGQLIDPLRPLATSVVHLLLGARPS